MYVRMHACTTYHDGSYVCMSMYVYMHVCMYGHACITINMNALAFLYTKNHLSMKDGNVNKTTGFFLRSGSTPSGSTELSMKIKGEEEGVTIQVFATLQ